MTFCRDGDISVSREYFSPQKGNEVLMIPLCLILYVVSGIEKSGGCELFSGTTNLNCGLEVMELVLL